MRLALVGNPNCGKTTLFNACTGARLKVANWPGVTVERKEGALAVGGERHVLVDLPGVYSLRAGTPEERVTREYLQSGGAEVILNIADATALERSLYLTLQLLALGKPVVLVLTMMDIAERRGLSIDTKLLQRRLGVPVVGVSARRESETERLLQAAKRAQRATVTRETGKRPVSGAESFAEIDRVLRGVVHGGAERVRLTEAIDKVVTHPLWGGLLFLCIMAGVFWVTFAVGDRGKAVMEQGLAWGTAAAERWLAGAGVSAAVRSLVVKGILAGVGSVLSFLPNLALLFFLLAILEDSGYLARVAYVLDGPMGKVGLSGRAALPMLLGFGCTVPAVLATRILDSERERLRVMAVTPFLSCGARLPIYVLFAGLFFEQHAMAVAYSMYLLGAAVAVGCLALLRHVGSNQTEGVALLLELPEYRLPSVRTLAVTVWGKCREYLTKAGTTIFLASLVLWGLLHLGAGGYTTDMSETLGAAVGRAVAPLLSPIGLGQWQIAVALLAGVSAKEVVVAACAVLFGAGNVGTAAGAVALRESLMAVGFGARNAYSMMVFSLLYTPCAATLAVLRKESGSRRYALLCAVGSLCVAWGVSFVGYRVG